MRDHFLMLQASKRFINVIAAATIQNTILEKLERMQKELSDMQHWDPDNALEIAKLREGIAQKSIELAASRKGYIDSLESGGK